MNEHLTLESDKPVHIIKTINDAELFIEDCRKIYKLHKNINQHKTFCGIDFEFNMNWKLKTRYIAFMQIIFVFDSDRYHDKTFIKPIYIINPLKFNKLKLFIKYVLCSGVIKIFHGSDSLDYPHIYDTLLKNNRRKFMKFINSSVDTRFLCEISKRFMSRLGSQLYEENRCSLYYAMFNHNVINRKLFDVLNKLASKINYNKNWLIGDLKPEQLLYISYDVMYLYDLLKELSTRMIPLSSIDNSIDKSIDIVSLVNRLYRFHMINRLGLSKISLKCKNIYEKYLAQKKVTNDYISNIDQKIMEIQISKILYKDNTGTEKTIDVYLEDIFSIDTIRKSIMYCLRIYRLDISASDTEYVDYLFDVSKTFKFMKGHKSILFLINIIKSKIEKMQNNIECDKNILKPI